MRVLHLRRVILPSRNKAMIRVNICIPPLLEGPSSLSQNRELRGVKRADAAIAARDSKEAKQYGNKTCPPQILSFEQGMYLERTCRRTRICVRSPPTPSRPLRWRAPWPDTVNSGGLGRKHTYADANQVSRTLCFTGAGNYARQQAYCDLECKANAKTRKAAAKGAGGTTTGL